jgi:hypothetical protein
MHSPPSKKRGFSMTRRNCESTSQATKFSRTLTMGPEVVRRFQADGAPKVTHLIAAQLRQNDLAVI